MLLNALCPLSPCRLIHFGLSFSFLATAMLLPSGKAAPLAADYRLESSLKSSLAAAPDCVSGTPGLLTWLRAEGNATDERGNHHGALVGNVGFPTGLVGQAFGFNGTDASVDLGPWFDLQTFTFSLWIKEGNSQQTYADIFDNNHTAFRSFVLQYANTGHSYVFGHFPSDDIVFDLTPGVWRHVVVTREPGFVTRLYLDGNQIGTLADASPILYDGSQFLRLSHWGGGGREWNGLIDEFQIYDRPLAATEVSAMFAAGLSGVCWNGLPPANCAPAPVGLIAWWPAENSALDSISGTSATLPTTTAYAAGMAGQAFSFNGSVEATGPSTPSLTNTTNSFTIEFWALPTAGRSATPEANSGISGIGNQRYAVGPEHGGFDGLKTGVGVSVGTNGVSVFEHGDGYLPSLLVYDTTIDRWTHIAVVYENKTPRLYLNGVLARTGVTSTRPLIFPSKSFGTIPNYPHYGPFAGLLDEVAIYNRALSSNEIAALYTSNSAGKCRPSCINAPAGMIGWWPGEGSTADLLSDNSGTFLGGPSYAPSVVGQAFNLTGDSLVALGDLPELNGATGLTLMAWVKKTPGPDHIGGILGKWDTGPNPSANSFLLFNGEDSYINRGGFALQFDNNSAGGLQGTTLLPENTWLHVAATWSSSDGQMRLYKNGALETSATAGQGQALRYHGEFTAKIGEWGLNNRPNSRWRGLIDEPMIFNRALSANEIAAIAAAGSAGVCAVILPAGLALWLRADSGVTVDGAGRVLDWKDQSGREHHGTSSARPELVSGALNGGPVVRFGHDGDQFLDLAGSVLSDQQFTIVAVVNERGGSGFREIISNWTPGNTFQSVFLGVIGNDSSPPPNIIADSAPEFSGVQGQNGWVNGYRNYTLSGGTEDYNPTTGFVAYSGGAGMGEWDGVNQHWTGTAWDLNTQAAGPWTSQAAQSAHPNGVNSAPNQEHWTIRRWSAAELSVETTLKIVWSVRKENTASGNGVTGGIWLNGKRVAAVAIAGNDGTGVTRTNYVSVKPADVVDLVLAPVGIDGERTDLSDGSITTMRIETAVPESRRVRFTDNFGGADQGNAGAGTIENSTRHFLFTGVNRASSVSVYQNRNEIARRDSPLSARNLNTPWVIGRQGALAGEYWRGDLAELLVFDKALSDAELATVWQHLEQKYFGGTPDLAIRSVTGPVDLVPGLPAAITYIVANEGTAPATGPWTDAVFLSHDTNVGLDFLVDTFVITNTLPPGGILTFTQQVVVPNNGPSGKLYFVVAIDAGNAIAETNEGNDELVENIGVTIPGTLTLALAANEIGEDAATLGASVTRNGDLAAPLTVTLASSDLTEAIAPNTGVIPAGQATMNFLLSVQRDGQLDGPQPVTLTANAAGFLTAAAPFSVLDADLPTLGLTFNPTRLPEGDSTTATLTRQGSTADSLSVNLGGPLGKLNFPSHVTIEAGLSETTFTVDSVEDATAQSSRTNRLTASADGFIAAATVLIVDDNDVPNLRVTLTSRTVSEGAGPQATTGKVTRDPSSPQSLTMTLFSGNPQAVQVPPSVTIPAGSTSAIFNVSVTDNTVVEGDRNVVIGGLLVDPGTELTLAEATPDLLTITDDDGPSLRLELGADVVGEGLSPATSGTVTRNTATTAALVVTLTSSAPTQATVPASVTIPAGAGSAIFPIASVADGVADGSQVVVITAAAAGFASSAKTLVVSDADLPDLAVASLTTPDSVIADTPFNLMFRIENQGLAASGSNFLQRILVSADPLPSPDDEVLFETPFESSILAGQFIEQTLQLRSPKTPGDYWIIAITDADNRIAEILESNNTLVSPKPLHVEKAFRATVTTDVTVAPPNTPVPLSGQATLTANNAPAAFVAVDIMVRVRDTERHIAALTDATGNYRITFQPLPGEGGTYSLAADYPGIINSPVQDTFSLLGLSIDRIGGGARVAEGSSVNLSSAVHNLANLPLTQLTAVVVSAPAGVTITASLAKATLEGDGTVNLALDLAAANGASGGTALVRVTSAEGATAELSLPITVELARPRLVATPDTIAAGMRREGQTTVQIAVTNLGGRATGPLNVLAPSAPWLKVSSGTLIPPLAPGAGALVSLLLTPPADLELGPYTGSIVVNSTNAGLNVPFTFHNLSDSIGNLLIEAVDEYTYYAAGSPKLANAAVRILDTITKDIIVTNLTGADGTFSVPNLREAYYDIEVTADGHSAFKTTFLVEAAKANRVTAFLSRQTVRYIFSVVPTEIEDRTRIVITTQFEAFVPIPVLTVDPPYFDLSNWSGSVTQVNVTLKNHGLLAANNVRFALPQHPEVEFSSLVSDIGTLAAQGSLIVPIVIRKVGSVGKAAVSRNRYAAKQATGGGSCYADASFSFDLVCGPQFNTYNIPLRFDQLPGCPRRIYTVVDPPVFAPFTFVGGGDGGGENRDPLIPGCPECFPSPPELFHPPRDGASANNCNPCLQGMTLSIVKCAMITPPAKAGNCLFQAAKCAVFAGFANSRTAALECMGGVGACFGGFASIPLQIPACLYPLRKCLGGVSGGGANGASLQSLSIRTESVDEVPSEAKPLLRQLDRVMAFVASITNVFGSDVWFQEINESNWLNWFAAFNSNIQPGSPAGQQISPAELSQLLSLPAPSAATTAGHVSQFAARWNRSIDYYERDILTLAQVPGGESVDFVATDVAAALGEAAVAAHDAAVADGYEDPLIALFQAGQEFLAKANSAGGGVCARVKLKIEQEAVITRDAFNASLEIANDTDQPLTDIFVELTFRSGTGEDTTHLFAVRPPSLDGLSAVNGTGRIAAKSSGKASWILIPTSDAAPDGPITHVVGGTLRYQQDGALITVPLMPSSINVLPNASLALKYFHQRDVFADDPLTDEIEPSIPYSLAVMIQNSGKGAARNVRIASAQPKIIENKKGLLIDFSIIATEVDGQSLTPSLTANFGDVAPGQIKIGRWLLKSTLQGLFTEYSASFEHLDGLGDKRLSLVQSVEIHELDHLVQAGGAFEDGQPDFLANDVPDFNDYPDTLHLSQGTNMPVIVVTNAVTDAPVSAAQLSVALTATMPAGWGYLRIPEPADGKFRLKEVRRADNSVVAFGTNVWTTDRTFIGFSQKPVRENILHLLDFKGAGPYQLLYEPLDPADTVAPTSAVAVLPAQSVAAIPVSWNGKDLPGGSGIAHYDVYVSVNGASFAPWLPKTTENGALYPGEVGNSYSFYSVATDFAGNQQAAPATPDAQTTVSVVNTVPVLTVAADQTVDEGELVTLVNAVIDNDVPANTLTWSLGSDAPASARINPATGVINWPTGEGSGPSTSQFAVIVRDNGQPSLSATGRVAVIIREVNSAPVLEAITNRAINELKTIKFQAQATDGDLPINALTFSLSSAPIGATITPSGLFTWTPTRLQGPSTNEIQVKATDNGVPALNATQSFTVLVRDSEGDFDLMAGSIAVRLASQLSVPLSINSGLDLASISFLLEVSSDRLEDVTLEPLIPELAIATLTPESPERFHVRLVAASGQLLQGNRAIANLTFHPGTNPHSEIVTLTPQNITAIRSGGEFVPHGRGIDGHLVLIGLEPLLVAEPGSPVTLKLYGIPDHTYTLEQTPGINLAPSWQFLLQYKQTNLVHLLPITIDAPTMLYQLREN